MKYYTLNQIIKKYKLDENTIKFLDYVYSECKKKKIVVKLCKSNKVFTDYGFASAGYFDSFNKCIVVAANVDYWLEVLAHEFSHFLQWKNKLKLYKNNIFYWWLVKDIELNPIDAKREFTLARNIELDCEQRALKLIKKYSLPINIEEYIIASNYKLYLFTMKYKLRNWFTIKNCIWNKLEKIVDNSRIMSKTELNNPPKEFQNLILRNYIKENI